MLSTHGFAHLAVLSWMKIDHFAVVDSVIWPLNGSEAGGDLVLIQTSLPFKGQVTEQTTVKWCIITYKTTEATFTCPYQTSIFTCPGKKFTCPRQSALHHKTSTRATQWQIHRFYMCSKNNTWKHWKWVGTDSLHILALVPRSHVLMRAPV